MPVEISLEEFNLITSLTESVFRVARMQRGLGRLVIDITQSNESELSNYQIVFDRLMYFDGHFQWKNAKLIVEQDKEIWPSLMINIPLSNKKEIYHDESN